MCYASALSLSYRPGVSTIVVFPSHPRSLPVYYEVRYVQALILAEVLKSSSLSEVSPYKNALHKVLLPVPVLPIIQSTTFVSP